MLAGAMVVIRTHSHEEIIPPREPLASFPHRLGPWTGADLSIPADVRSVLGPGDFLLRNYRTEASISPVVNLFVAYFPSQRAGDTIHSPKNCLPGGGWFPLESSQIQISLPGRPSFLANRYLVGLGDRRQLVVYWYWAHGRTVASEAWAKYYLMADSIQLHRTDGALVRVITEVLPQETPVDAQRRLSALLTDAVPRLESHIPR